MLDMDEEIREIKKEIIESRGLIIKTNNLGNSLSADLRSIAKRQLNYERNLNWNSGVAYVLFALLTFVGLKLASDARVREVESKQKQLQGKVDELSKSLHQERAHAEARRRAESQAAAFYELVRQHKRAEAVDAYEKLQAVELSPTEANLFKDIVDKFKYELSLAGYQNGLDLLRSGRFAEAADSFREAIQLKADGSHIPATKYQLGVALRKLNKPGEALVLAKAVMEQNIDREIQDDATWLFALCSEELSMFDDAKNALKHLIRKWPSSDLTSHAKSKLSELIKQHGVLRADHTGAPPTAAPSQAP